MKYILEKMKEYDEEYGDLNRLIAYSILAFLVFILDIVLFFNWIAY